MKRCEFQKQLEEIDTEKLVEIDNRLYREYA